MSRNTIILYKPEMKEIARKLRRNMTLSEVLLWQQIRKKTLGVQFHRQVPMVCFVVDFYCHELMLAIEVDGVSHDNPQNAVSDEERQKILESYGVSFIRIPDREVKQNLDGVMRYLEMKVGEMLR
ncbi:endonuclease domain-containing protein [Gracilimonas sp.]|uniref:endonuclease domain-containing protein n=1 Tax=Gracilimonas sp. TaxID=1974203 RepID=UPI0028717D1E|nr:endonuclease domain-containing protein [Gracilimonas sp.]